MIPVIELLYEVDLKLNKIATNEHQSIPLEDKIIVLNQSQVQLIKQKVGENNVYKLGLDSFKKRYDDLQFLISQDNVKLNSSNIIINQFSGDITTLNPKYMLYVDGFILANKDTCLNRVLHPILIKHSDLWVYTNNSLTRPSFEYQETLCTISNNSFEVYTDSTFTPVIAQINFIRYPKKIDYIGYQDFNGNNSITQDCELPYYLKDELVDLTVQELARSTENNIAASYSEKRISSDE